MRFRGLLTTGTVRALTPKQPIGHHFRIGPQNRRDAGGSFTLYEHGYEGSSLSTYDGDVYFGLTIWMYGQQMFLEDTNSQ